MTSALGFLRGMGVGWLATSVLLLMVFTDASAQSTTMSPTGVIRGTVLDSNGRPIENAEVSVRQLERVTGTGPQGRFLFAGVKPGKYNVDVRSLGYESGSARVTVHDTAAIVTFMLTRVTFSLPARVTTANRGGLSGVIADTGYKALANARIRVIGVPDETTTDSAGAFFLPLQPGRYMVRVEREGYARQLIGVSIPESAGREIAAWMVPAKGKDNPQIGANLFDMNKRLIGADFGGGSRPVGGPASARIFSREDIDRLGHRDLLTFLRAVAGTPVPSDCWAYINGGPRRDPIWRMTLMDVEFVEVYHKGVQRMIPGREVGTPAQQADQRLARATTPNAMCTVVVYVWRRQ